VSHVTLHYPLSRSATKYLSHLCWVLLIALTLLLLVNVSEAAPAGKRGQHTPFDRCLYRCYRTFVSCFRSASSGDQVNLCIATYNTCFPSCYDMA
ncbi:hypothetical protein BgiBS90_000486, partial [Biomphalaria glabrata]